LAFLAKYNGLAYRDFLARHPDLEKITLTRQQMEAIIRDLIDYTDRDEEATAWEEQATRSAARIAELEATLTEVLAMERRCLEDSMDADPWIGYATPLAAVDRIARGMAIVQEVIAAQDAREGTSRPSEATEGAKTGIFGCVYGRP
jgi:hypothetical protein